ncbi:hypothetical protein [Candidatus Fervidibacter sacchari]|uniref:hypothetical protein n=1 Tax=Candidatus Fervidibacter sacchari TaxID=1448929 RepID=UPI0004A37DBA|nr:hypothetical protein [Candidatus Fervidibacter sacchari]
MPVDLLLIVEGRRDEAVLRAIIEKRARDLGIREVSLEFRHRSGAVYTEGIEVAAIERRNFRKVILLWDHADSRYANRTPQRAQGIVQRELNRKTLKNCSKAIAVDPELEIWLCQDWSAVVKVLGVDESKIQQWLEEWGKEVEKVPKEALEYLCKRAGERPNAELWSEIASHANLKLWERKCPSFRWLCRQLRRWFS